MKAKNKSTLLLLCLGYLTAITFGYADRKHDERGGHGHDHDSQSDHHKKKAGPNGGRVVHAGGAQFEFFVTDDHKAQLTFLDHHGKVISPPHLHIQLTGGDRSHPTRLSFKQKGKVLISSGTLPAGKNAPVVLQIEVGHNEKPTYEKFTLNMSVCPGCKYKEYACICDHGHHGHDESKEHGHKH